MRHSAFTLWLFPLVFPLVLVCSPAARSSASWGDREAGMKVLFIGNDPTETGELPRMLEIMGREMGLEVVARAVAVEGYGMGDTRKGGTALRALRANDWDLVILHQEPSTMAGEDLALRRWVRHFARVIREEGAEPALFMLWPVSTRPALFPFVSESYRKAAEAAGTSLIPVGAAWQSAWALDPTLELYASDGIHASGMGALLGGMVILQHLLTTSSPSGGGVLDTPPPFPSFGLPEGLARTLQTAAWEANRRFNPKKPSLPFEAPYQLQTGGPEMGVRLGSR